MRKSTSIPCGLRLSAWDKLPFDLRNLIDTQVTTMQAIIDAKGYNTKYWMIYHDWSQLKLQLYYYNKTLCCCLTWIMTKFVFHAYNRFCNTRSLSSAILQLTAANHMRSRLIFAKLKIRIFKIIFRRRVYFQNFFAQRFGREYRVFPPNISTKGQVWRSPSEKTIVPILFLVHGNFHYPSHLGVQFRPPIIAKKSETSNYVHNVVFID